MPYVVHRLKGFVQFFGVVSLEGTKMATNTSSRPVWSKSDFPREVAVFKFVGEDRTNYSIKLSRSFRRDEKSEWETTDYLTEGDLLPAAKLLNEADTFVREDRQKDYDDRRQESRS